MAMKLSVIVVFLALALVSVADSMKINDAFDAQLGLAYFGDDERGTGGLLGSKTCNGLVGECIGEENEMMMGSEDNVRRSLAGRRKHIGYGALRRNSTPCKKRGNSYYGCGSASKVNPYRRGCDKITHCQKYL